MNDLFSHLGVLDVPGNMILEFRIDLNVCVFGIVRFSSVSLVSFDE